MKKLISLFLMMCMLTSICVFVPITVSADASGTCGDNLTWTLDNDGTLTIRGTGEMKFRRDGGYGPVVPWQAKKINVKEVVIEEGVTSIANYAFMKCRNLMSVSIPSSMKRIDGDAFYECENLTDVYINNLVDFCDISFGGNIANFLFSNCKNLYINGILTTNLKFPEGITTINDRAFSCCKCINGITLPKSLENIGTYAFYACENITEVFFYDNIEEIGHGAFSNCTNLKIITIPQKALNIEAGAFSDTAYYNELTYWKNNALYIDNHLIEINQDVSDKNCILEGTYTIAGDVFFNNEILSEIVIPDGVRSIGSGAFDQCSQLKNIFIPKTLTNIYECAFRSCKNLENIYYSGTSQEWNNIKIDEGNECMTNATIHYNPSDSNNTSITEVKISEKNIPSNNPILSLNSNGVTMMLGEQEWIGGWISGIYTKIPDAEFIITNSNENVLSIINQNSMCMSPMAEGEECLSSMDAFVKGVAPGTSTLTFYCQGKELGKVNVTVEAVIAETILDETILKAEILNRNSQFESYRNTIQSPAVVLNNALMNNSSQSWAAAYMFTYELSKILSLSIPDLEKFDMKSYYEAVLMDILENDNESVWTDFYSTWGNIYGGYNEDILQKIIDEISEFEKYKDTKLSKETDIEIVLDTIKDTKGEFKDIKIDFSLFDTFGFCYDTLTDNLAVIDEIYAYSAITQEKIDVLKAIQEKTSNAELAKACESMIKRYQEVHSEVVAEVAASAARESLIATGKNILELSQSVTVDLFLQVAQTTSATELVKSYSTGKMIMTGSRLATDLVINSTDISKNIFVIAAYSDIENEIKQVISSYETAFETNKTYDNAVKYIASADVFKAALLNSCDLYIKFVKDVESGTKGLEVAKGLILGEPKDILKNLWQVNAEYSEKIKQAEHIKSMIQTTDFYDTYGTDIVEYISHIVSTTPSAWAQEYVDWAIANNLLPYDYLRGNYQNNITRAEFCTLLTFMIQEFTGKNIEELQGNLPYDPKLFSDSYYDYVYYMASLGIVNGVSETEFNPLGEITREEAAVMLYRAAKVAGCDVSAPATNLNGVSNWATDGVNFVVDRGIMNGTDVGFEPQGKYTKEQAITTFVRFIENLK